MEVTRRKARLFTEKDDEFIKKNYLKIPVKRIASILGRSGYGTFNRMKILGLEVPKEIIEKRKADSLKGGRGWNKGMKQKDYMTHEKIVKTTKTRFKKGNEPHNTRKDYDLSLRSDGYIWVRRKKGEWELLHRFIYSVHHDYKLETTDNIIFIDGNRQNFAIDNLRKVSNDELMSINTIHRYPEDIKAAIKALSKLKRQIKKYAE